MYTLETYNTSILIFIKTYKVMYLFKKKSDILNSVENLGIILSNALIYFLNCQMKILLYFAITTHKWLSIILQGL